MSKYTSNGMHKDDPMNPESHWNDWSKSLDEVETKSKSNCDKKIKQEHSKRLELIISELKCFSNLSYYKDLIRELEKELGMNK